MLTGSAQSTPGGNSASKEANASFLEKRSKKLFNTGPVVVATVCPTRTAQRSKSFLVLFFKKEHVLLKPYVLRNHSNGYA
jgi:hypothetical protein